MSDRLIKLMGGIFAFELIFVVAVKFFRSDTWNAMKALSIGEMVNQYPMYAIPFLIIVCTLSVLVTMCICTALLSFFRNLNERD